MAGLDFIKENGPKWFAEMVGTFMLVLAVFCNVLHPSPFGVIAIASTLMVFIYSLGGVSGGHFNPAVTLGVQCTNTGFGWANVALYWLFQFIGGCAAAGMASWNFGSVFALNPAAGWGNAIAAEFLYTFLLVFVVLNVAVAKRSQPNEMYGLAIAFTVVAGGYGAGKLSGGAFNPAIALSVGLVSAIVKGNFMLLGYAGVYMVVELLGGVAAHAMFRLIRPEEFDACPFVKQDASATSKTPLMWSKDGAEGGDADIEVGLVQKLAAEFLGTFFLVLTVGLNVASNVPAAAGVSIGSALMCGIYALGNVSGAHFNPAVTVAIVASRRNKIDLLSAGLYIVAQLFGSVVAGLAFGAMVGGAPITQPAAGHSWFHVFFAECVFTFVLTFTVLNVATTENALKSFYGLAIGFCVVIGAYSIGAISGAHLNPAVSTGLDVSGVVFAGTSFWRCMLYTVFQLVGGLLAAGMFWAAQRGEYAEKETE